MGLATSLATGAAATERPAEGSGGPEGIGGPERYEALFDIYLGGLKLAEMAVGARIDTGGYRAEARLETAGALGWMYTAGFEAAAEGANGPTGDGTGARGWRTLRFTADSFDSDNRQRLDMRYGLRGGRPAPVALEAEPPFKPKPWQVDPMAQTGTVDPLTGALAALAPQPRERLCARTVQVFDGRRRYELAFGPPEPEGETLRCPVVYRRLAGFKPRKMADPEFPFRMWFAETEGGLWTLKRAMGETPFGLAALVRRGAD